MTLLDETPDCPSCGGQLSEHDDSGWWYSCAACGWEYGTSGPDPEPLTIGTAPWTRGLAHRLAGAEREQADAVIAQEIP